MLSKQQALDLKDLIPVIRRKDNNPVTHVIHVTPEHAVVTDGRMLIRIENPGIEPGFYNHELQKLSDGYCEYPDVSKVFPDGEPIGTFTANVYKTTEKANLALDYSHIIIGAAKLGINLNYWLVSKLRPSTYTVTVYGEKNPVKIKDDSGYTALIMPFLD